MDELERLEQKLLNVKLHTSKALDTRVQGLLGKAEVAAPSVRRSSLRRILRSRRWWAVAAAGLFVAVIVLTRTGGPSAYAELNEAMENTRAAEWVHFESTLCTGPTCETAEVWMSFRPFRLFARQGGKVEYHDGPAKRSYEYDPDSRTVTVRYDHSPEALTGAASLYDVMLRTFEEREARGGELTSASEQFEGKNYRVFTLRDKGSGATLRLYVDPVVRRIVKMEAQAQGQTTVVEYQYPPQGPTDIYALGVPRDAKVVDIAPPQEAEKLNALVEARRQNFAASYRAIICRGYVEGSRQHTSEVNLAYKKGERCRIDVYTPNAIAGPAGEGRRSGPVPAEDLAALEEWLTTRPISESWFTETRRVQGGSVVTRVKRDAEGRLQKGPYEVPHADLVETLAWPRLRLEGEVTLLGPVESPFGELVGLESARQGRMISPDSLQLPRRIRHYVNPARDYIVERAVDEARADAPWQKDARWAEGAAADQVSLSWSQSVEVLEYAQTSDGQWYPRKIFGPTMTPAPAFVTLVYVDTGRAIPDDVLDPDAVTSPEAYEVTGLFERAFAKALAEIDARAEWPASPVEVCRLYWEARRAKRYDEMAVLFPLLSAESWQRLCKDEAPAEYVFGEPQEQTGTKYVSVPYAAKKHYEEHRAYNFKMLLTNERSAQGRYYIISGN